MKTIIVPVDFSRQSYNAARFAMAIAQETKAKIVLVHVYQMQVPELAVKEFAKTLSSTKSKTLKKLEDMTQFEIKVFGDADTLIEYEVHEGTPSTEIIKAANNHNAGMIVMGTQGADGLGETIFGTNTSKVVDQSKIPVLVVPESAKFSGLKLFVFATDFQEIKNNNTLDAMIEIALLFNSKIMILSVAKNEDEIPSAPEAFEMINLELLFERIPYSYHKAISKNASSAIEEFVNEHYPDILVLMPKKHGFVKKIFNKSVTRNLVLHTKTPILCLPEYAQT